MKKESSKGKKTMKTNRKTSNQFGYTVNIDNTMTETVRTRIMDLLDREEGSWTGTITQLRNAIGFSRSKRTVTTNPSIFRRVVNTVAYSLRKEGVSVKFGRGTDHNRTRFVSLIQN